MQNKDKKQPGCPQAGNSSEGAEQKTPSHLKRMNSYGNLSQKDILLNLKENKKLAAASLLLFEETISCVHACASAWCLWVMSLQTGKLNGGHRDEVGESVFVYGVVTVPHLLVVLV